MVASEPIRKVDMREPKATSTASSATLKGATTTSARRRIVDSQTAAATTTVGSSLDRAGKGRGGQQQQDAEMEAEWDEDQETEILGPLVPGSPDQRLTLMDEVVLLGLKDQQGYLSFLNDSISYVLRGCIVMELALRRRIRTAREPGAIRRLFPDRLIEVVDGSSTGEVLLDEALRMMKMERQSIASWLDLLSGETWNPLKVGYQLKQVRERIAKGLVDKGVLRTEKHSFLFFDMATHPLASAHAKEDLIHRVAGVCLGRGPMPSLRSVALASAALTANVLENALSGLPYAERENACSRAEDLLREYSSPPERNHPLSPANEIIAGVLTVFSRLDSLIY